MQRPVVRIAWEQLVQPVVLTSHQVDLLHALAYVSPLAWAGPTIVTVLDLSFILYPEQFRPLNRLYLNLFTRLSVRRAREVIAISESTKRDMVRLLGVDEGKVAVIYCGVDPSFCTRDAAEVEHFRHTRGLPKRYMLFVGTLEPRKNIIGLLEAYHHLTRRWQPCDGEKPALVIVGAEGWYYDEVYRKVEQLELRPSVHFAGYVPAEELPWWYGAADLFVYPSFYEGFGLPVLEAMACGVPVITSNRSALPEVVGDAGVTVDPDESEPLAHAMHRVLTDGEMREELRRRGLQRAGSFSWERTARETVTRYQRALEQEGR